MSSKKITYKLISLLLLTLLHGCNYFDKITDKDSNDITAPYLYSISENLFMKQDTPIFDHSAHAAANDKIGEEPEQLANSYLYFSCFTNTSNFKFYSAKKLIKQYKKDQSASPPYSTPFGFNNDVSCMNLNQLKESLASQKAENMPQWIFDMKSHTELNNVTYIILPKILDIHDRLYKSYAELNSLILKYGNDFDAKKIDSDIKHLSNIGWQLTLATRKFFDVAKQNMMKIDEANARAEAMKGLKTFTQEIEMAGNQPSEALEQSVADITAAINNLEKALNE